jgi:hypothetical protein
MNTTCKVCGFDISTYSVTISLETNTHTFNCPVCGQGFDAVTEIKDKGVFYDDEAHGFVKWVGPVEASKTDIVVEEQIGEFRLQISAMARNFQDIFYPRALVFVLDGEILPNQLFASPENSKRYAIIITGRELDPSDAFLDLQFRLKGTSSQFRIALPAAVTRAMTDKNSGATSNGSVVTVWPNFKRPGWQETTGVGETIDYESWRDYFVMFDTADTGIKLQSLRLVGDGSLEKMFDGSLPRGSLDFPPEYIEITTQLTKTGLSQTYRTCFFIQLNTYKVQKSALSKVLRVAIDFGTSNTCVCYRIPSDAERGDAGDNAVVPKLLKLRNKNCEVVRGLQIAGSGLHTWLPDLEGQDFVSSELVFRDEPQNILGQVDLHPIVDYTIPEARWRTGQEKKVCTGFKWKHATEPAAVREKFADLQRMYLDLLFRLVAAELVANNGPLAGTEVHPNKFELVYTYPLAMPKERWEALGRTLELVGQSVRKRTGIAMTVKVGVDESRAGEADIKMQGQGERIFMDIGGGTTDIAVIEQRDNVTNRELLVVDSLRYAGNDFLAALSDDANGGHISTRPLIELQRRVRFFKRAALEDISVFEGSEARKEEAQDALERFLRGITQYLARLMILRLNSVGEAKPAKLHVFLLGNGWNFVLFLPRDPLAASSATPKEVMQEEVTKRLIRELEKFRQGEFIKFDPPDQWTDLFELNFPQEPKTAVARGALEVTRRPIDGVERTFIGCDVEIVTTRGVEALRWDTYLPLELGALVDRVSIKNPIVAFESLRVPDYQHDHAPDTDLKDIDIRRYVDNQHGKLVGSAFNVYLERWYKNFLTGKWASNHRGSR